MTKYLQTHFDEDVPKLFQQWKKTVNHTKTILKAILKRNNRSIYRTQLKYSVLIYHLLQFHCVKVCSTMSTLLLKDFLPVAKNILD